MNSFIVPAHNEQRGIGRALQAIHAAAQVIGRPYEIIVVDDSSTDETASVAHEHNATVLPVRHRQIAATRNSGAGAAQGKRFFFVDADTIISPGVLASALRSLDKGAAGGGAPARFEADAPLYARLLLLWLGLSMRVAGISGGTPPQQTPTCPCGNRQMSGCPHDCQTSSILSFKQIKSWIPSINKILFLGVAGRVVVKFIAVRFILSHISRALCNLPRIGLFYGPESGTKLEIEGFTPSSEEDKSSHFDQVGPGYFSNVGIPLLLGRDFTERDNATAPSVAVINETMAKFYFGSGNPIGKHITTRIQDKPLQLEIVGVARDAQDHNFWSKPVRRFYVSYFQPIDGITAANFAIRTVGDPAALDALLRREVKALDGNLTVLRIREVKSLMDQSLVQERLIAKLSSFFGLLAATLAAIGLYGVMAYDVVQRTKEIGVRMALGAQKINILSLVVGQGMKLALAGLGAGVLAALALTRIVRSLLYGTTPTDPVTFIAVVLTLASVAILACWLPARRASKVDPMEALRYE